MPARFGEVTSSDAHRNVPTSMMNLNMSDDICITGFSGRLPESSNIEEFKKNLFDGVDMVNDDPRRWPAGENNHLRHAPKIIDSVFFYKKGLYDLPTRMGKIKQEDLENLDAQFFKLHQKQAECMDPQLRMLLESTYEAIVDAGINPQDIKGSKTGVYIGVSNSETEQFWCKDPDSVNGYGLTGCARAMFANRISFTFDFKGPSYAVDTGNFDSFLLNKKNTSNTYIFYTI